MLISSTYMHSWFDVQLDQKILESLYFFLGQQSKVVRHLKSGMHKCECTCLRQGTVTILFFLASPLLQSLNFSNNFWVENIFEIILMFKSKTNGGSRKSQIPTIKISSALARGKIVLSCYTFLVISNCWVNKKKTFQSRI